MSAKSRTSLMLSTTVRKELERIVGRGAVSFSKEDLICYSYDATNESHLPEAVVFADSADQISLILKMANSEGFPVVPRGAGSGFTGGSVPVEGGVVVSTERMNRILEIDAENMTALAQPGVICGDLHSRVEDMGLFYPPDPSSLKFSTIGGNIAENAGGPRGLKYGVTRDYVLGLEVVLATGDVVTTGVRTLKGVVGYDLTRLIVGSEGTLGVVTKARLRLLPLPEASVVMLCVFDRLEDATRAVSAVIGANVIPSALELIDGVCIKAVREFAPEAIAEAEAVLIIEVDGAADTVREEASRVESVCIEAGASKVTVAKERKEVKGLWKARRAISPSLGKIRPDRLNEDVVVPRSELTALISGVGEIATKRGVIIANFGHAGDGNIHVNVMLDKSDPDEFERAVAAVGDLFELTLGLGGTISGEHGIGTAKAPYLAMELSELEIDVMKGIKRVFDPKGVLNPGKIFPAPNLGGSGKDADQG